MQIPNTPSPVANAAEQLRIARMVAPAADVASPAACPTELADEPLMARVATGDRSAFATLARRHGRGLQRFAQRLLRNPDDADEVAQETLLRVWQHAARWQADRVRFTTWLFSIAHHQCIDRLRRSGRDQSLDDDAWAALPADDTASGAPERARAANDTRKQVERALARLPERQRSALVLCFYQGFGNRDAAQILGVGVEAVESLLARARRTLRAELASFRDGTTP